MKSFLPLLLLLCFLSINVKAQDVVIDRAYCIRASHTFSSKGDCKSDPDFVSATLTLTGNKRDNKNNKPKTIKKTQSNIPLFSGSFPNTVINSKDATVFFANDTVICHAKAKDIRIDTEVEYSIFSLQRGSGNSNSEGGSDPCFHLSKKREEYTQITRITVDDPVFIDSVYVNSNNQNYRNDEKIRLKIGQYYNNGNAPILQVKTSTSGWRDVEQIPINSNNILDFTYDYLMKSDNLKSEYYKWFGKRLNFRIIKTLKNDTLTSGNIRGVGNIIIYPEGPQFEIQNIKRTNCEDEVKIHVKLLDNDLSGFVDTTHVSPDSTSEANMYWRIFKGQDPKNYAGSYNCRMESSDNGTYEIIPNTDKSNPFGEEHGDQDWTLQLELIAEDGGAESFACNKVFTVPEKPESIEVYELEGRAYGINKLDSEDYYDLPHRLDCYAKIKIKDDYKIRSRLPYRIYNGNELIKVINDSTVIEDTIAPDEMVDFENDWDEYLDVFLKDDSYILEFHSSTRDYWGYESCLIKVLRNEEKIDSYYNAHFDNLFNNKNGYIFNDKLVYDHATAIVNNDESGDSAQWDRFYKMFVAHYIPPHFYPGLNFSWYTESNFPKIGSDIGIFNYELGNGTTYNGSFEMGHNLETALIQEVHDKYKIYDFSGIETGYTTYDLTGESYNLGNLRSYLAYHMVSHYRLDYDLSNVMIKDDCSYMEYYSYHYNDDYHLEFEYNKLQSLVKDGSGRFRTSIFDISISLGKTAPIRLYLYYASYPCHLYHKDWAFYSSFSSPFDLEYRKNFIRHYYSDRIEHEVYIEYKDKNNYIEAAYKAYGEQQLQDTTSSYYLYQKNQYYNQWIAEKKGIRVELANFDTPYNLTLKDGDDCPYDFTAKVTAPESPIFELTAASTPPPTVCGTGSVSITYKEGGMPPFTYKGTVLKLNTETTVSLTWAEYNTLEIEGRGPDIPLDSITKYEDNKWESSSDYLSVDATNQTCKETPPQVTLSLSSTGDNIDFRITENGNTVTESESSNGSTTLDLPPFTGAINPLENETRTYIAHAKRDGSCDYAVPFQITDNRLDLTSEITSHAATIEGNGTVSFSIINKPNATCTFSYQKDDENPVEESILTSHSRSWSESLPAGNYEFKLEYDGCEIIKYDTITEPSFTMIANISEYPQDAIGGLDLEFQDQSNFNLDSIELSNDNEIINFNVTEQVELVEGSYSIYLYYNGVKSGEIYRFDYPSSPQVPRPSLLFSDAKCFGGQGSVTLPDWGEYSYSIKTLNYDLDWTNKDTIISIDTGVHMINLMRLIQSVNDNITENRSVIYSFTDTITSPTPLSINLADNSKKHLNCYGDNDGLVALSISGGTGLEYQCKDSVSDWSSDTIFSNLSAGSYIYYAQDKNECLTSLSVTIEENEAVKLTNLTISEPTCELNNGEFTIETQGGEKGASYTYISGDVNGSKDTSLVIDSLLEDGHAIMLLADSLANGASYSVKVRDVFGCVDSTLVTLQQYRNPAINSVTITDVLCYEEPTGVAELVTIKDKSSADYSGLNSNAWEYVTLADTGASHLDTLRSLGAFVGLNDGPYELYVYDSIGCRSNTRFSITIDQPDTAIYLKIGAITKVAIKGEATAMIEARVFGGNNVPKNISLFNNGDSVMSQTVANEHPFYFRNLKAGNYTLKASEQQACQVASEEITVLEPDTALSFIVLDKQDALCKARVGAFTVQGIGGWGGYSYKRSTDASFSKANIFPDLYAGHYIVTVSDRLGGIFSDTVNIIEPKDSLQARLSDVLLPTCSSSGNGSMTMKVSGGTAPYYTWLAGVDDTASIANTAPYTFQQSTAGSHLIHIADSNGCKYELEAILSDENLLRIESIETTHATSSITSDGTITVIAQGGTSPKSYAWSTPDAVLPYTTTALSGMASDYYTVEVSDQKGCTVSKLEYLPAFTDNVLDVMAQQDEHSYRAEDGSAELWSHIDSLTRVKVTTPDGIVEHQSSDSSAHFHMEGNNVYLNHLKSGQYSVAGFNARGDKAIAQFTIIEYQQYHISESTTIHAGRIDEPSGSISIGLSGGAGGNTYVWHNLDEPGIPLVLPEGGDSTQLLNAKAGHYSFTATDRYGNSIVDTFEVKQPEIALDITVKDYLNESCKTYEDAYVQVEAIGGWGNYQFRMDTTVYYRNGAIWSRLEVRQFKFYVIDEWGITDSVTISITEPDYLHSSIALIDSVNCKNRGDGHILFDITGGTKPYCYASAEASEIWKHDTIASDFDKGDYFLAQDFTEGDYTFYFTDSNQCVGQDTLTAYMPEPDSLLFSAISVTHTTCDTDNGIMSVALQGGTPSYHYTWTDSYSKVISTDSTVSDLMQSGTYTLKVLDGHDCPQELTQRIKPSTNPRVANIDTTRVICYAEDNGTATIMEVVSGVPYAPYHLTWENGDTGVYSTNYKAGLHHVIIADTNQCTTTSYFEITQPDTVSLRLSDYKDAHCFEYNDGFLEITPAGGVGNYSYLWTNGDTLARTDSLYKGDYGITLNDSNLCTITDEFTITEPVKELVDLGEDLRICPSNAIELDGEDFTTHQWVFEEDTISFDRFLTISEEGDYAVEITNAIGCFAWDTFNLSIGNDALQADFLMSSQANLGDTLTLFEMSNLTLDSLYWEYESTKFVELEDSTMPTYMLHLESLDTGLYNIRLWAYSGGCVSKEIKQIEIVYGNDSLIDDDRMGYRKPLITQLKVYPNPTDGNFVLEVELREAADIEVTTFSVSYATPIDMRYDYGMKEYQLDYQLMGLNPGVYVIMVRANDERQQMKIVIE